MSAAADQESLLIRQDDGVTWLTLNRPSRLNALDQALRSAIVEAMAGAASDDATRVLVITGAGERAFCAGQDLNESQGLADAQESGWIDSWSRMFEAFLSFPKPIVASLNGVTAGGGFEIAVFSDIRIASTKARFIMAEIDVGLPAMTGSAWLSAHVFDSRMLDIMLTGRTVSADEAAHMGLVHYLAEPHSLRERTQDVSVALAAKPAHAMRATVKRFRGVRRREIQRTDLMAEMPRYQSEAMASGEPQRIMEAFLAARAARRRGN